MAIKNIPDFFELKAFGKFFSGHCLFGKTIRDNGIWANVRSGKKISGK